MIKSHGLAIMTSSRLSGARGHAATEWGARQRESAARIRGETRRRWQSKTENFCSISGHFQLNGRFHSIHAKFARELREWTLQQEIYVSKDQEVEPSAPKARPDPLSDQVSARLIARAPRNFVRTVYVRFRAVTRID